MNGLHVHCGKCFNRRCAVIEENSINCPMVKCVNACGQIFHQCKSEDHKLVCLESLVPCILTQYGCRSMVVKGQMSFHLQNCPANVMICSKKWHRWLCDKSALEDTISNKLVQKIGQLEIVKSRLDIAWALCDQKLFILETFPTETLNHVLNSQSNPLKMQQTVRKNAEVINGHELNYIKKESNVENGLTDEPSNNENTDNEDANKKKRWGLKFRHYNWSYLQKTFEDKCVGPGPNLDIDLMLFLSPVAEPKSRDFVEHLFSIIGVGNRNLYDYQDIEISLPYYTHTSAQTDAVVDGFVKIPPELLSKSFSHNKNDLFDHKMLTKSLHLDLEPDKRERYNPKNKYLQSFMCGCVFLPTDYKNHCKNVHQEIMCGTSNWLEEKCPYTQYGCKFVRQNFCPDGHDSRVVYNMQEDCFAIQPSFPKETLNQGEVHIFDLPSEVHSLLLVYLDNLSLRSLSKTCTYFKELCERTVSHRGIVTFDWSLKKYEDGSESWRMSDFKWKFTQAISEIRNWKLSNLPPMCQHISQCEFRKNTLDRAKYNQKKTKFITNENVDTNVQTNNLS